MVEEIVTMSDGVKKSADVRVVQGIGTRCVSLSRSGCSAEIAGRESRGICAVFT
jgi:hypothetical protein